MNWLFGRSSKVFWQSAALAAVLVVLFSSLATLLDMLIVQNTDDSLFVLIPVTAVLLICSVLLTVTAVAGYWKSHLWLLVSTLTIFSVGLMLTATGSISVFSDFTMLQSALWLIVLCSWVFRYWAKHGKSCMLLFNAFITLVSFWALFISSSSQVLTLSPVTSFNSAIFLSLIGLANIAFTLSMPKQLQLEPAGIGFLLSVFIALSVTLIWFYNIHKMQDEVRTASENLSARLQQNIDSLLSTQQGLLTRLVERLNAQGNNVDQQYFQFEAESYLADFAYIEYLALTTSAAQPAFSAARQPEVKNWYNSYLQRYFSTFRQRLAPMSAENVFLLDYDQRIDHSLLYVFKRSLQQNTLITLTASIDYKLALQQIVANILPVGHQLNIYQTPNKVLLYSSSSEASRCIKQQYYDIKVHNNVHWLAEDCSNLQNMPLGLAVSSVIALYAGFIAITLLLLSQQWQQKSHKHRKKLLSANIQLRQSLTRQHQLQLNQQQIMDNSADVICMFDKDGCFLELSASVKAVLGYEIEELIGKSFLELVHPADRSITLDEVRKIEAGSITLNFRNRYIRKDGSVVHLLWSSRYASNVQVLYAIAHNITELVRQEDLQSAQQTILKLISAEHGIAGIFSQICIMAQQHIPGVKAAISVMDSNKLKLVAAPAFGNEWCHKLAEVAVNAEAVTCGEAAYYRSLTICKNIRLAPAWFGMAQLTQDEAIMSCWSMPMLLDSGTVLGTFALYSPQICAPKKDELELMLLCCRLAIIAIEKYQQRLALQVSEQRYRSLYEFNPDPVFSLDLNGCFLKMNNAGVILLGYDPKQIIGKHYSVVLPSTNLVQVEQHFANAIKGLPQSYETLVQMSGESPIDFLVTNLPIVVDDRVVGVFGIAKDITERNKTANALQQSLTRLSMQSRTLQGLNDCATGIHSDWDNWQTLKFITAEVKRIMECCQVAVLLTDQHYEGLPIWHCCVAEHHTSLSEAQANWLLTLIREQLSDGYVFDDKNIQQFAGSEHQPELQHFLQDNRIIVSAVSDRVGVIIGCLLVIDCDCRHFDQDEQLLTQQFAKLIFSALEYRQLLQSTISAEQELQQQLQFNKAVTDSMSDVLLVTDLAGNVSILNPSAEQLLQRCGVTISHQMISEILPLSPQNWQRNGSYDMLIQLNVDTAILDYHCKISPLRSNATQVGWVITLHDVSAERRVDAITRERDQFFTLSLELFCLVDLEGCFVQLNPAFAKVLQYSPTELIGQPYMSVIDKNDHQLIHNAVMTLQSGMDINDLEFRVISRNGELCWLQLSAALSGGIIFCAARDITARKVSEAQLQQTLYELKRSNDELNEFAYVASHDLQEPLRKIRTFGDRLLQKVSHEDETVQDYVLRMTNAAERMQGLISDLLTYSRLNAADMRVEKVDIAALTQDVLAMFDEVINQNCSQIITDFTADIEADERQLRQLMQNLLSNALKFHKPGQTAKIWLKTQQQAASVRLTVADQGVGFDARYSEKIFTPFQRLHNRTEYAGTGIGLSIVKKIAERHGASVKVEAQQGVGASFHIDFPVTPMADNKQPDKTNAVGGVYAQNSVSR